MWVWSYFIVTWIVFSVLWIISQRVVKRHRRGFRIFIILFGLVWTSWRIDLFYWEMIWGFILSLVTGTLFWILIGRYNPVGNEDDDNIKVYGLDD